LDLDSNEEQLDVKYSNSEEVVEFFLKNIMDFITNNSTLNSNKNNVIIIKVIIELIYFLFVFVF
jgi:hypothetical protein